eukprot:COSAG06_NODE_4090_length_4585_cov_2.219795_7_plen_83_part_00
MLLPIRMLPFCDRRAGLTVAIIRQMTDVLMSFEGPTGHSSFEVVSLGMLFAKAVTVLIFYGWIPPLMRTSVACTYGTLRTQR